MSRARTQSTTLPFSSLFFDYSKFVSTLSRHYVASRLLQSVISGRPVSSAAREELELTFVKHEALSDFLVLLDWRSRRPTLDGLTLSVAGPGGSTSTAASPPPPLIPEATAQMH